MEKKLKVGNKKITGRRDEEETDNHDPASLHAPPAEDLGAPGYEHVDNYSNDNGDGEDSTDGIEEDKNPDHSDNADDSQNNNSYIAPDDVNNQDDQLAGMEDDCMEDDYREEPTDNEYEPDGREVHDDTTPAAGSSALAHNVFFGLRAPSAGCYDGHCSHQMRFLALEASTAILCFWEP